MAGDFQFIAAQLSSASGSCFNSFLLLSARRGAKNRVTLFLAFRGFATERLSFSFQPNDPALPLFSFDSNGV